MPRSAPPVFATPPQVSAFASQGTWTAVPAISPRQMSWFRLPPLPVPFLTILRRPLYYLMNFS